MKVCYRYIGVRVPGTTIPIECFIVSKRIPAARRERTLTALLNGLQRGISVLDPSEITCEYGYYPYCPLCPHGYERHEEWMREDECEWVCLLREAEEGKAYE